MGTIFSVMAGLKNNIYVKYIALALVCFCVGMFSGCKYVNTKNLEQIVQMQVSVAKKTKSLQEKVNTITQQSQLQAQINQKKYSELQNEFNQVSSDLNKCVLTNKQLQLIYKSANQTMYTTNDHRIGRIVTADAGQAAGSEFTCADLGQTIIAHDEMYFACKNRLDSLQQVIREILQKNK